MELGSIILDRTDSYLKELGRDERALVMAHMRRLCQAQYSSVTIKSLGMGVRELIVNHHRITYCIHDELVYFISAFRKKSRKTPTNELTYAIKIYKIITNYEK